ncbi:hypothetical protein [Neisseria chenwenguii]|uniref:hypothetical protein n=1 Tax=Neisseria chenwenguii TaxID=1853278 RepID=UPI001E341988|nr:hypothetical protein [Neisseria chenwenguii]
MEKELGHLQLLCMKISPYITRSQFELLKKGLNMATLMEKDALNRTGASVQALIA